MATYDAQGVYRDEQGNVAPDPRTGDMGPGISQAIANLFGTSYTPGRAWDPSMGPEEEFNPNVPHDPTALATGRSGGGTFTESQKDGAYVKIGKAVIFHIKIGLSYVTGAGGSLTIDSLPFTIDTESGAQIGSGIGFAGSWTAPEPDAWRANPNTSQLVLTYRNDTYWYDLPASAAGNTSYVQLCGSYKSV